MRPIFPTIICACLPALGFAQSTPRVYVGAAATMFRYAPFKSYGSNYFGPAVTAGVAFTSRWALEASAQYVRRRGSFGASGVSSNGGTTTYTSNFGTYTLLIPLLARYTFTTSTSPLHVDGLAGLTWNHGSTHATDNFLIDGVASTVDYRTTSNYLALTVGPQLRYSLTSHFDAKLSLPVNLHLSSSGAPFGERVYLSPQLGVQYTFGK